MRLALALILTASPVLAQDWFTRDGDIFLDTSDLDARLRGQVLTFYDDGESHFYHDGRYTYAYDGGAGGTAYGWFEVSEGATVCIDFVNGARRCDRYAENNGRLVLLTEDRLRFPIRETRDAGPDPEG